MKQFSSSTYGSCQHIYIKYDDRNDTRIKTNIEKFHQNNTGPKERPKFEWSIIYKSIFDTKHELK